MSEKKKTVLTIDGASMHLLLIKNLLFKHFNVRQTSSGEMALFILGSEIVDLILLDVEVPGMSVFEFIDAVREIPEAKDIPIICTASRATANMLPELMRIGVKDYVVKPISAQALNEKVFGVLGMPEPK